MASDLPLHPSTFAVVSDIHGDAQALERVLERIRELDVRGGLLVCGDLILTYRSDIDPAAALDLLMEQELLGAVAGNTDRWFVDGTLESYQPHDERGRALRDAMIRLKARLSTRQLEFLRSLPRSLELAVAGGTLYATHASPLSDERGLTLDLTVEQLTERLAGISARYLVTGHLHRAFTRVFGELTQFAVGAVSRHPHERSSGPEFGLIMPSGDGMIFVPQCLAASGSHVS
jgi:predicted phosphodiesterase